MNPEQIEQLIRELLNTGEILATKGYELALKQVYSEIYRTFGWTIFLIILSIVAHLVAKKCVVLSKKVPGYEEDNYRLSASVLWIFSVIALFASFPVANTAISYLLNPEWYAVKFLVGTFIR